MAGTERRASPTPSRRPPTPTDATRSSETSTPGAAADAARRPARDHRDRGTAGRRVVQRVAAGTGPVALDAERASGYRYSPRAYLIQLRREGSGTALVDPIAYDDLASLDDVLR